MSDLTADQVLSEIRRLLLPTVDAQMASLVTLHRILQDERDAARKDLKIANELNDRLREQLDRVTTQCGKLAYDLEGERIEIARLHDRNIGGTKTEVKQLQDQLANEKTVCAERLRVMGLVIDNLKTDLMMANSRRVAFVGGTAQEELDALRERLERTERISQERGDLLEEARKGYDSLKSALHHPYKGKDGR